MATPRKKPEERLKRGRPSRFKPEYVQQVEKLASLGLTDAQMADFFGVSEATLNNWKVAHPDFLEANARGKPDPNSLVERSLFQRALGGFTIKKTIKDDKGNVIKTMEEEIPADVTAATKWLFNRDPKRWRDQQHVEVFGTLDMTTLTPEEFEKRKAALLAQGAQNGEKKS